MIIINEIQIKDWQNMLEIFDVLCIHQDRNLWNLRGQADALWHLTPSLVRYFEREGVPSPKAHGIEISTFREFQTQAHLYVPHTVLEQISADVSWMMLMQHYSCPTRLLDWTQSPFIATYFAVEQCVEADGAIWLFNSSKLDTLMLQKYGHLKDRIDRIFDHEYAIPAIYPILGAIHTERSAAQQGSYTFCCSLVGSHEKIIDECFAEKFPNANGAVDKRLNKIIIPARLKNEFLARLGTMNINARTLFPGADGLGRSAAELVKQRVWTGN